MSDNMDKRHRLVLNCYVALAAVEAIANLSFNTPSNTLAVAAVRDIQRHVKNAAERHPTLRSGHYHADDIAISVEQITRLACNYVLPSRKCDALADQMAFVCIRAMAEAKESLLVFDEDRAAREAEDRASREAARA